MVVLREFTGPAPSREDLTGVDVVDWREPSVGILDLRECGIRSLSIYDVSAPLTVLLPSSLKGLSLTGEPAQVHVDRPVPAGARVAIWGELGDTIPAWAAPAGQLEIARCARLDLSLLREMPHLRSLTIREVAGTVSGCSSLAEAQALERVAFYHCYDIDTAGFPHHSALPRLEWITAAGVSAADGKVLRGRLDGFWNAHLSDLRSTAWLEKYRDDPFRAWQESSPRLARKASALWREAVSGLKTADSISGRERAIEAFAAALGELTDDEPLDTLEREQVGEAVRGLAIKHLPERHPLAGWEPL